MEVRRAIHRKDNRHKEEVKETVGKTVYLSFYQSVIPVTW